MSAPPKLSVLLCTNKYDRFCDQSITSIEQQNFTDFEFIIVANGITDSDFVALQSRCIDVRTRLLRTDIKGLAFSLNFGLHQCRAELIARMDADDIAYPQRLQLQYQYMIDHPQVVVCSSNYHIISEKNIVLGYKRLPIDNQAIRKSLWYSNPICHPAVIFRRNQIIQQGGYFGNGGAEDYHLWLRLAHDKNMQFANIPEPLIDYRTASISSFARRSRSAYIHASCALFEAFLQTGKLKWLLGCIIYIAKSFFFVRQP